MNRAYRSLWNAQTATFVAVPENASSAGKKTASRRTVLGGADGFALKALTLLVLLAVGGSVNALPVGGVVAAGGASISTGAGNTSIIQTTQNAVINWQSFNIGSAESVNITQPNNNSVMLNRVLGADPSSILGTLSANGKVFLVNPNGVLFGPGASVNVGGLVASTLNISDSDFMAGRYKFIGAGGTVLNQGTLNANGGAVALLGATVSNEGTIVANLGSVALAAGNAITLDVAGDGLLNVSVDQGAVNALVQNGGLIQADGGQVLLTAQSASGLLQSAVNNTGLIRAQTLENHNGTIRLIGDRQTGTVTVSGVLDVSGTGAGQTGGNITLTGHHVGLFGGQLNASGDVGGGSVLLGGDYQGTNPAVPNAAATYMSADAGISADAVTRGNGGKVVLWADDSTRVAGRITARGGALGGDGGLIETSGHALDVAGIRVDASAANGLAGNWLLDPADVTIGAGTIGATLSAGVYSPDSGLNAASIDAAALVAVLNGGTDVTVTTTNNGTPGSGVGDITVAAALTWTTGKILTLNALHDVIVNAGSAITASTAGSGIVLNAGNDVKVNAALVASALGSKIALTAGQDVLVNAALTASAANTVLSMSAGRNVAVTSALTATGSGAKIDLTAGGNASVFTTTADGGGAVSVIANKDVTVNGQISASGGTVLLRADSDGSGPGIIGGTVIFTGDNTVSAVSAANTVVRFNPAGYANTTTEIATYVAKIVAGGADVKAWVFAQGVDKQYDGDATATLQFRDPLGDNPNVGNTVTLDGGTATFNTKDVGVLKPVTFSGYSVGGPDLAKFDLYSALGVASGNGTTTAAITPAPLTIKANDASKNYGEVLTLPTTAFTTPVAPVAGETVGSVTETSPGTPVTASVGGSPYIITPSSATGGTFNPSNYTITYATGLLTVLPKALIGSITAADKVYDATSTATITGRTLVGVVGADDVTYTGGTGTFDTASVGSGKTVTGSGLGLSGTSAGNYTVNPTVGRGEKSDGWDVSKTAWKGRG
ncbi:filamentous hemagglutinin N-terminal domain-containing protein [Azonexus sp.]|uniref:two-partner secretion domain-containing protein n=1 Tax=Azonexus sp. TaxID=1872668 RepID=UPI0027BB0022|nr:YDG domain-containing protein [Azonexus sp.]